MNRQGRPASLLNGLAKALGIDCTYNVSTLSRTPGREVLKYEAEKHSSFTVAIARENAPIVRELVALRMLDGSEILVPRVIDHGSVIVEGEQYFYLARTYVDGITLADLDLFGLLGDSDVENILQRAGRVVAEISSMTVSGYGALTENGTGEADDWPAALLTDDSSVFRPADESLQAADVADLYERFKEIARTILDRDVEGQNSRLMHGDLSPAHFVVSHDNRTVGLIDFEHALCGDPLADLVRWDYYHGQRFPVNLLAESYRSLRPLSDSFNTALRVRIYRLACAFGEEFHVGHRCSWMGNPSRANIPSIMSELADLCSAAKLKGSSPDRSPEYDSP